jgi:hypothetical protein
MSDSVVVSWSFQGERSEKQSRGAVWGSGWLKRHKKAEADAVRAPRFALQVPLHFRTPEDFAWNMGKTENISTSGVLFQSGKVLNVDTPIEMTFTVPPETLGKPGGLVQCRGKIVRKAGNAGPNARLSLAAKFLHYRFARASRDSYA